MRMGMGIITTPATRKMSKQKTTITSTTTTLKNYNIIDYDYLKRNLIGL